MTDSRDLYAVHPSRRHFVLASAAAGAALTTAGQSWAMIAQSAGAATAPAPLADWTAGDIPAQKGRTIIVTGGNGFPAEERSGIGYHVALEMAAAGGNVIIASRNAERGAEAVRQIKQRSPDAQIRFETLDLADLSSVADFTRRIAASEARIDTLVNNAATMGSLQREISADGYERVMATNALGHFALTARLAPLLRRGQNARVVFVSSNKVHTPAAVINFDDLHAERSYDQDVAYSQTKTAALLMAFELQRRSVAGGWGIASLASHPGVARTSLIPDGPGLGPQSRPGQNFLTRPEMFQPAATGALPTLYAATATAVAGGDYYGPKGPNEMHGLPNHARVPAGATDPQLAARFWTVAEELTKTSFG